MELQRKLNNKFTDTNPLCMKDNNVNCVNIFDTSFKSKKICDDGFSKVTKFKRNFKSLRKIFSFFFFFINV